MVASWAWLAAGRAVGSTGVADAIDPEGAAGAVETGTWTAALGACDGAESSAAAWGWSEEVEAGRSVVLGSTGGTGVSVAAVISAAGAPDPLVSAADAEGGSGAATGAEAAPTPMASPVTSDFLYWVAAAADVLPSPPQVLPKEFLAIVAAKFSNRAGRGGSTRLALARHGDTRFCIEPAHIWQRACLSSTRALRVPQRDAPAVLHPAQPCSTAPPAQREPPCRLFHPPASGLSKGRQEISRRREGLCWERGAAATAYSQSWDDQCSSCPTGWLEAPRRGSGQGERWECQQARDVPGSWRRAEANCGAAGGRAADKKMARKENAASYEQAERLLSYKLYREQSLRLEGVRKRPEGVLVGDDAKGLQRLGDVLDVVGSGVNAAR